MGSLFFTVHTEVSIYEWLIDHKKARKQNSQWLFTRYQNERPKKKKKKSNLKTKRKNPIISVSAAFCF